MQLKGLVRFFTIALILICLYQLSFTWIVRSHENEMEAKAQSWVNRLNAKPEAKYPGNKQLQQAYADTLEDLKDERLRRLLDSTKGSKIGPFGFTTYKDAKDKELMLGLDLQGGMSVTMEVGMDGLIKSLANYTKDANFNKALNNAIQRKANSDADLISLFNDEYRKLTNNAAMAPFFSLRSNGLIKYNDSNDKVIGYLREQASSAFNNTYRILRTRIDRFGVASPTINADPAKGIINIELAGVNDPERVRRYLQSTANLQFFEVYQLPQVSEPLLAAEQALSSYLKGVSLTDSAAIAADSARRAADTSKQVKPEDAPLRSLIAFDQGQQDPKTGAMRFPSYLGYVQLKDTATVNSYLNLELVKNRFPGNLVFMYGKNENTNPQAANFIPLYAIKTLDNGTAELEGEHVTQAAQDNDEFGKVAIKMTMDAVGTRIWAKMTERAAPNAQNGMVPQPIAIVLDNFVYSAPFVNGVIPTGSSQITGNFTVKEAQDLAEILQSGKLPAPAKIVQENVVGPTLGQEAITGGSLAFFISFLVIFALMLIYYNTGGWIANIALMLNLVFTIGILSALGFTLTAPGIAGLVLTIGMAVDTNVVIFERIKEELTKGKGYQTAISDGYRRSYAPVLDGHITTMLTAIILAYFGLGPVLGFATTQIIGLLLSLFTGILVSRLITDWYTNKNRHFQYFTAVSKKIFAHANYNFTKYRKVAYVISGIVFVMGVASFFHGFDEGVEFAGGRSYTINFTSAPNIEDVRNELSKEQYFGESPIVKTVGEASSLNITTAYKIKETGNNVDSSVERTLYAGLSKFLPAGTTFETFSSVHKQSSQTVLPTISDDLKAGATQATILALIVICLYIFIRFRDWRYSVGTIFALMHDVFVTLIVFSFFKDIVPFPLEIDQHFIAAILTVIGFSMNDTIIVYDRIREDNSLLRTESQEHIVNLAINQTLSRTIMTSLTVLLTILILFIFGGEVTRGFAFAMLIGVVTGSYSSIFVAAPILIDFNKGRRLGMKQESSAPKVVKTTAKA